MRVARQEKNGNLVKIFLKMSYFLADNRPIISSFVVFEQ